MTKSKNATFLFFRDFIEYHQDRFEDYSLLVYKNKALITVFPANKFNNKIYSHQGLTYGGLVLNDEITFNSVMKSYQSILQFLNKKNIAELEIKPLPKIYHTLPSDEIDYLLFKTNADLVKKDITSVIDAKYKLEMLSSNRKRGLKKGKSQNLKVVETEGFQDFWNEILIPNLKIIHNVKPVHSLEEIIHLKSKFPKHIRQFNVYKNDNVVAGATVFETKHVAHIQYISANSDKQELGSLDLLFDILIKDIFKTKKYFDFGISNESQGQHINEGLLSWKESFGARSIVHDCYSIQTKNYVELNTIML